MWQRWFTGRTHTGSTGNALIKNLNYMYHQLPNERLVYKRSLCDWATQSLTQCQKRDVEAHSWLMHDSMNFHVKIRLIGWSTVKCNGQNLLDHVTHIGFIYQHLPFSINFVSSSNKTESLIKKKTLGPFNYQEWLFLKIYIKKIR